MVGSCLRGDECGTEKSCGVGGVVFTDGQITGRRFWYW